MFGRLGMAATAVAFWATGCASGATDAKTPTADANGDHAEVGKAAPDLSIQSVNNKGKISLDSLQGKVVVVDFWATWCGPCKESLPKLDALGKKLGDKVEVVGVSVDDEKNGVAEFAKSNGATFAVGWDEGHTLAGKWKVKTMPTTFVVDTSGKVRFIHDGYHPGEIEKLGSEIATIADEPSSGKPKSEKAAAAEKGGTEKPAEKPAEQAPATQDKATTDDKTADAASDDTPPPPKKGTKKKGGKKPAAAPAKKTTKKKKPAAQPQS